MLEQTIPWMMIPAAVIIGSSQALLFPEKWQSEIYFAKRYFGKRGVRIVLLAIVVVLFAVIGSPLVRNDAESVAKKMLPLLPEASYWVDGNEQKAKLLHFNSGRYFFADLEDPGRLTVLPGHVIERIEIGR